MAVRYFCDGCGNEMSTPKINTNVKVCNLEVADVASGSVKGHNLCVKCTEKIITVVEQLRKENNMQEIGPGIDMKFHKK